MRSRSKMSRFRRFGASLLAGSVFCVAGFATAQAPVSGPPSTAAQEPSGTQPSTVSPGPASAAAPIEPAPMEPGPIGRTMEAVNPANWNWPTFNPPQWNLPKLLPAPEDKERIVQKKNSLWDDVSATSHKSWQKTKEVLHPQKLNPMNWWSAPAAAPPSRDSGSPGFFGSLFQPNPEPEARVADVSEFLEQDRVNR